MTDGMQLMIDVLEDANLPVVTFHCAECSACGTGEGPLLWRAADVHVRNTGHALVWTDGHDDSVFDTAG